MPTIGEALDALEASLFVGREAHVEEFRGWIGERTGGPSILAVSGPGGIGKSSLLGAFARVGQEQGRSVFWADGRDVSTAEALWTALGGATAQESVAAINGSKPLVMLDTFERLEDLTPYLQREFLPNLDTDVRVVIAGRYPLGRVWSAWQKVIRPLPLRGLSPDESEAFLTRRGIRDPRLVKQIVRSTGGLPLALSLAADMVQQLGTRRFRSARDWPLVVRSLVERLLEDVDDPVLRELLEVCAVVRQFDEQTLGSVSGLTDIGAAFDRLCRLSVVRPAEHGLSLHDDVQRILADDLRWRNPPRHRELRLRALAHYRDRARDAPPQERERLVAERLYLWGNEIIQPLMFAPGAAEDVYLEPGEGSAVQEIQAIWQAHVERLALQGYPADAASPFDRERERAWMHTLLTEPATRLRIARTADGRAVGFSTSTCVYPGSVPLLQDHPVFRPLLAAYLGERGLAGLPDVPQESPYTYLLHTATAADPDRPGGRGAEPTTSTAQAALLRDVIGQLASGGAYLATVASPERKRLCLALGFQPVEGVRVEVGPGVEAEGFVLDLRGVGVEAWLEALLQGRGAPRVLSKEEIERALQVVLPRWSEDEVLKASPLAELSARDGPPSAEGVRDLVQSALRRARRAGGPAQELAYRALELAYLDRGVSHERVAERLAVSRSTFYRLLKRGIRGLSQSMAEA